MNLGSKENSNSTPVKVDVDEFFDEFDFKPITSGLGFHQKNANPKPAFTERVTPQAATQTPSVSTPFLREDENSVFQNDLSIFYNRNVSSKHETPEVEEVKHKKANSSIRLAAFLADIVFILSLLSIVMVVMARIIHMDVVTALKSYPQEVMPLFVSLFIGFYLMYFSIFDKVPGASLGKTIFNLRVVSKKDHKALSFFQLLNRSAITLLGFLSLGLFSYFDLQNKITNSEVIRLK